MPQTDFYLLDEDLFAISADLFSMGARLVPDMEYSTATYKELVCLDDVREIRFAKKVLLYFAVHAEWSDRPLPMRSTVKEQDGRKIHYLPQRVAPTLDIYCPGLRDVSGSLYVATGFVAYHSSYYSDVGTPEKAPAGLRTAYNSVCKVLRKGSTTLRLENRTLHVTKHVKQNGYQLAGLGTSAEADAL